MPTSNQQTGTDGNTSSSNSAGPKNPQSRTSVSSSIAGLWAALGAFAIWGVLPLFWRSLDFIQPLVITLNRVVWSFFLLLILIIKAGKLKETISLLRHRRTALLVTACSLFLTANWLTFIWAVNNGHVVETSLGYFLNPLLNMLTGVLFFRERPAFLQWLAIGLAFIGVGVQIVIFGSIPWIALALGCTFAIYGALRKIETIDSMPGLFLETAVIFPFVSAVLLWFIINGDTSLTTSVTQTVHVALAGVFTTVPLILFAYSAQRLTLTTVGLIQYISPSMTLFIGVVIFGESITDGQMASFVMIWVALAIYSLESLRQYRKTQNLTEWKK
ncbi:EamA family transporter RarD [Desulfovibrio sp. OttesenSCG-928-C06]|nr:EamA family transporter RarD [Desulfovibrio sp. OttesenSCG-928-C06]